MQIDDVLKERGSVHGDFGLNSAGSQALKDVMRASPNWEDLPPFMKQALEVIQDKISRILCGDPLYKDHWVDISGYATLVVNSLKEFEEYKAKEEVRPDGTDEVQKYTIEYDGEGCWIFWNPHAEGAEWGPLLDPDMKVSEALLRNGRAIAGDGITYWGRTKDYEDLEIVGYRTEKREEEVNGCWPHFTTRYSYEDSVAQCDGHAPFNQDGTPSEEAKIIETIDEMIGILDRVLGTTPQN